MRRRPPSSSQQLQAAGVNPVDWKMVAGGLAGAFPHHFPLIPGWDVAGVVHAVGPAVQEFAAGDEVVGYVRKDHVQFGTYAELVGATPRHLAPNPSSVTFAEAAGLPLAGLTALQSLRLVGAAEGDTVLVHGAAGGDRDGQRAQSRLPATAGSHTCDLRRGAGAARA
jgi:NADPH:quinone reductase-like Zn-dependent oxidoreductase